MSALIYCPFPDRPSARDCVNTLIEERLIVCANILGGVESLFIWNGVRGEAEEVGVLFKTDASALDSAIARLAVLHPYDTPSIMGWRCDAVHPATAAWLGAKGQKV